MKFREPLDAGWRAPPRLQLQPDQRARLLGRDRGLHDDAARRCSTRVGGFDERFAVGFNDTDLCLRLARPASVLYDGHTAARHHESATRAHDQGGRPIPKATTRACAPAGRAFSATATRSTPAAHRRPAPTTPPHRHRMVRPSRRAHRHPPRPPQRQPPAAPVGWGNAAHPRPRDQLRPDRARATSLGSIRTSRTTRWPGRRMRGRRRRCIPVFYGSFDWHSCVHSYWLLARLLRRFPAARGGGGDRGAVRPAADAGEDRGGVRVSWRRRRRGGSSGRMAGHGC